jgi:hypothetical protein
MLAGIVASCVKTNPVSSVPEINYKTFNLGIVVDTLGNTVKRGELVFSFIDGDADIGIASNPYLDTLDMPIEEKYNLILTPYEKIDGKYVIIESDSTLPQPYYRIPYDQKLTRVGQNKTIEGEIKLTIDFLIEPEYDTFRYDFYILDRAMHKSNIESTDDIVLGTLTVSQDNL